MYDIASGIIKFNKQQSININYNSRRASRVKTKRYQTSLRTNYPYSSLTPSPQFNSYYGGNRDKSHLLFPQRKGPHVHHHISSRGFFHAHSVQSNSTTHRRCYLRLQGGAGEWLRLVPTCDVILGRPCAGLPTLPPRHTCGRWTFICKCMITDKGYTCMQYIHTYIRSYGSIKSIYWTMKQTQNINSRQAWEGHSNIIKNKREMLWKVRISTDRRIGWLTLRLEGRGIGGRAGTPAFPPLCPSLLPPSPFPASLTSSYIPSLRHLFPALPPSLPKSLKVKYSRDVIYTRALIHPAPKFSEWHKTYSLSK